MQRPALVSTHAAPGVVGRAATGLGAHRFATLRIVVVYGAILAAASLALQWLQYRYLVRAYSFETYVALVAFAFLGLGVWAGARLFRRAPSITPFVPNTRVRQTLGISERELEVLELLAAGRSNKEIAGRLSVSPNTVKTHVGKLYGKLDVKRRTEAIRRAPRARDAPITRFSDDSAEITRSGDCSSAAQSLSWRVRKTHRSARP